MNLGYSIAESITTLAYDSFRIPINKTLSDSVKLTLRSSVVESIHFLVWVPIWHIKNNTIWI